mgnify:CR=1 FL=1
MIGEQKNKDDGYVTIATKVPSYVADLLSILAKQRGMEVYELLQLLVNGFISAAKHEGPIDTEHRMLLESIKLDVAFNKAFNFASPTAKTEIAQMILILQQPGKKGFGLTMITKPFLDTPTVTRCLDDIVERVVEVAMKGLYRELRQIGVTFESQSIRETLILMCDAQKIANLDQSDHDEMPGYGTFHDFGKDVVYGQKFKRVPHRTPDSVANQMSIHFDESDVPDLPELQDNEGEFKGNADDGFEYDGFRPFDQEP